MRGDHQSRVLIGGHPETAAHIVVSAGLYLLFPFGLSVRSPWLVTRLRAQQSTTARICSGGKAQ